MKAMEHTAHTTPRYTDVIFDYCGVLIDWRARRTIEGLYPPGVVDMFFDPADPHGVAYYDDLADLGWSEERIIADYEREHGPAVAWIMRLYFEFQRLGFYDMIEGIPTLMRDLHARGVRLWGLTNFTVRGVREMYGKYRGWGCSAARSFQRRRRRQAGSAHLQHRDRPFPSRSRADAVRG